MPHYTCDPNMEVAGATAMALLTHVNSEQTLPILHKHGLSQIDPAAWYPTQRVLDVLSDISELPGAMWDFVAIGMAAGEIGYNSLPEAMRTMPFADFLEQYAKVFAMRHRNVNGAILVEAMRNSHQHVQLIFDVPYPDDLMYGIFYTYARRFLPKGRPFTIKYDDLTPRKALGGQKTILHVMW